MRNTKNIILGVIGVFITIYTALIGMNVYSLETHKNQLSQVVSRAVENSLENGVVNQDETALVQQLEQEIRESLTEKSNVSVEVKMVDLEKGILSVAVTEEFSYITGRTKSITQEKTAIIDKLQVEEEFVTVQFMVDGEIYKEYTLVPGEECPMPKAPEAVFNGWIEYGTENTELVETIGAVWENRVYLAVSE